MREHSKIVYRPKDCNLSQLSSGLGRTPIALCDDFDRVVTDDYSLSDQIQSISHLLTYADHCDCYSNSKVRKKCCAIHDSFSLAVDRVCLVTYDLIYGMDCSLMKQVYLVDAIGMLGFDLSLLASYAAAVAVAVSCSFNDSSL